MATGLNKLDVLMCMFTYLPRVHSILIVIDASLSQVALYVVVVAAMRPKTNGSFIGRVHDWMDGLRSIPVR